MASFLRALTISAALALPLAAAYSADAAPVRRARAHAAVARPAAPSTAIISLPLQPIVPASQRVCASKTASGLGYTMLRPATGARPAASDTVLINYIGYLAATGAVFDQNTRSPLAVGGVIPGFSEGLQMLAKTGVIRLCIPAAMGYGARGSGPIPANSDLVFQVELLDFRTAAQLDEMRKQQAAEDAPQKDPSPDAR